MLGACAATAWVNNDFHIYQTLLVDFLSDTIIFLEDCPSKDMRSAFTEYIHQV